jgi:hypothetical protein
MAPSKATEASLSDRKLAKRLVTQNPCKGCCHAANDAEDMVARTLNWKTVKRLVVQNPCVGCCKHGNDAEALVVRTPDIGIRMDAAVPSLGPLQDFRIDGTDIPRRIFTTELSGILGVLVLLVVGTLLWYRRKHRRGGTKVSSKLSESMEKAEIQDDRNLFPTSVQLDESD